MIYSIICLLISVVFLIVGFLCVVNLERVGGRVLGISFVFSMASYMFAIEDGLTTIKTISMVLLALNITTVILFIEMFVEWTTDLLHEV